MEINLSPIGYVHCGIENTSDAPRYYTVSDEEGYIEVNPEFASGLHRLNERKNIVVLFNFHKSIGYDLITTTPSDKIPKGVFSTCSNRRPNGIGMSILKLIRVDWNRVYVKDLDMVDGTPVIDIKPFNIIEKGYVF